MGSSGWLNVLSAGRSLLAHPDIPRNRPSFLIRYREAHYFEGQLDLRVVVVSDILISPMGLRPTNGDEKSRIDRSLAVTAR